MHEGAVSMREGTTCTREGTKRIGEGTLCGSTRRLGGSIGALIAGPISEHHER
jgi:uncharacterized membrane protein YsdA (DUF1294 family)